MEFDTSINTIALHRAWLCSTCIYRQVTSIPQPCIDHASVCPPVHQFELVKLARRHWISSEAWLSRLIDLTYRLRNYVFYLFISGKTYNSNTGTVSNIDKRHQSGSCIHLYTVAYSCLESNANR